MKPVFRHGLLITVIGILVVFTNLGGPRLWDRDEPRNAGCTAEMLARGDWITPVFDGELRTHKPILLYWFMMVAYAVFGVNEFAARFWSAGLAIATALMTYGMGRRLFSPVVGVWAAVILLTTLMFDVAARAATPDSLLMFWGTAAIFVYVLGTFSATESTAHASRTTVLPDAADGASSSQVRLFPRWSLAIVMYACMGMAVLAKGPVGLVMPTAVIGMFLLIQRLPEVSSRIAGGRLARTVDWLTALVRPFRPVHFLQTCWSMRPITALAVVLVVALPWYFAVGLQTDGQWVRGFLLDHNLGRAAQSLEGHGGSILYYPLALLVGFFPWSVFAVPTVFEIMRRLRLRVGAHGGTVFALCWIGVYMGIFSIARTKLPSYITPCYPAVAMLVASFVVSWLRGAVLSESYWPHAAFGVLASVGAVITVAVPFAATRYLPGEQWLACIGLIPLLTAAAALWFVRHQARRRAAVTFAVGAVLFTTSLFTLGAARVDHHQTFDQLITVMRAHCDNPRIGVLGAAEPSWVFYTGAPIDKLFAPQLIPNVPEQRILLGTPRTRDWQEKPFWNIWHYLQQEPNRFAITTARHLGQIGELPDDVTVLARTSYFMRDEELVLLASPETIRRTAARPVRTGRRR